jgi:rSAM/selenodomain-associated transferase 2
MRARRGSTGPAAPAAAAGDGARRAELAVVIPVLEDTDRLATLLGRLRTLQTEPLELIVVSGASDAAVRSLCAQHGCRYLEMSPNRGRQLQSGACAAQAGTLWFLHADAEPHADSLSSIRTALRLGAESGCFRFEFQGPSRWYKRGLAALVNFRVAAGGIPYGDQGLFARRNAYVECGGFTPEPLFEEVRLIRRLRARRSFAVLATPIRVATRRWERDGWWRRSVLNRWLALCHLCGVPAAELARRYRMPRDRRRP